MLPKFLSCLAARIRVLCAVVCPAVVCSGLILSAVAPLRAAEHEVVQKDRSFSQTEITIKPGDKITFRNADDIVHNVFSMTPGMEFDLRRQAPGASSTVPFDKEGVAEVRCSIHPKMKLVVTVKK